MPVRTLDEIAAPSHPLRRGNRGYFAMAKGKDVIDAKIRDVVDTAPNERVARPSYGCLIWRLPFEPEDKITLSLAQTHITDAVTAWVPDIYVKSVRCAFEIDGTGEYTGRLQIAVTWELRTTRTGTPYTTEFLTRYRR